MISDLSSTSAVPPSDLAVVQRDVAADDGNDAAARAVWTLAMEFALILLSLAATSLAKLNSPPPKPLDRFWTTLVCFRYVVERKVSRPAPAPAQARIRGARRQVGRVDAVGFDDVESTFGVEKFLNYNDPGSRVREPAAVAGIPRWTGKDGQEYGEWTSAG